MHVRLLVVLLLATATFTAAQNRNSPVCPETERLQAEKEASTLRTWDALYQSWRKYRHCNDVDAEEGYSESKARVLADHWETLPRAAQLIKQDNTFERFLRVDVVMDTADIAKIKENAIHHCPADLGALCKKLKRTANEAIEENAAAEKH